MSRLRHHRDETPRSNYLGGSNQGSRFSALLGPGRVRQLRDTSVCREGADAYRVCSVPGESILALVGQLIFQARCRAFHSLDSVAIDGFTALDRKFDEAKEIGLSVRCSTSSGRSLARVLNRQYCDGTASR